MKNQLAKIILDAMKIREESYDKPAAALQQAADTKEREANPESLYAGMLTDWSKFYQKTLYDACIEAATKAGEVAVGELVYYSLYHAWNDCEAWANENKE